ncbi:recombinase family protein [Hyphococcus sp.]|uniref:recombinase family protein n=1 Tax=Hyphococcus sp. TaxID=2038636 RepID=UPI0035C6629A
MSSAPTPKPQGELAVIYARVSSSAQTKRGDGLGSQETRCREFARMKNYSVAQVFQDDMSGSLTTRPGMVKMLQFLRKHRNENPVVIIDDVSRLARGLEAHLQLRSAISDAGGRLESPSIEFGEDSDSILVENLLASVSQHQRQKNAEQTKNRMRARVMNGYWCFQAPIGYRYQRTSGHGKILVRNEPHATIIQEALEGFASGRFDTQVEVKRFLESRPDYPKDLPNGEIRNQRINDLLTRVVYAGMIEVPNWNISMRKGQHEGLISFETFERIQKRLKDGARAPSRIDLADDFPLRGAVLCSDCNKPLTACWSKGKMRKYPYYFCFTKGCESYRKSIPRDRIEGEFTTLMEGIRPTRNLFEIAKKMFRQAWDLRLAQGEAMKDTLRRDLKKVDTQIEALMDRIVDASSMTVIAAYEKRISALERDKLSIEEKLVDTGAPLHAFEEMFEHSLKFLANPLKLWLSDRIEHKRTALKLTFSERLAYDRNQGFRTPETTLPFKALGGISGSNIEMAHP